MTLILPNSTFYHVGRTGGHWVSHVLWRSGLIQRRLYPLHLTPSNAASNADFEERPNKFCFVRHPLSWLASLWCHEMEFGWHPDSLVTQQAYSEDFSEFLEKMLAAWPEGPCSAHMEPYLGACNYVGQLEFIARDLAAALDAGGEIYDRSVLTLPAINTSGLARIKNAAVAPVGILEKIMASETEFNGRFGYHHIPETLIREANAPVSVLWPVLPLKAGADIAEIETALDLGATRLKYDYNFHSGRLTPRLKIYRREQYTLIEALESAGGALGSVAFMGENDPYFAYLLKQIGARAVDFVTFSENLLPAELMRLIEADIRVVDYTTFSAGQSVPSDLYDAILLSGSDNMGPLFELDLARAAARLKPGGVLRFIVPLLNLNVDEPIKVVWPYKDGSTSYYSLAYIDNLLHSLGFSDIRKEQAYSQSPYPDFVNQSASLALNQGVDPENLLGRALISAIMAYGEEQNEYTVNILQNWIQHTPQNIANQPLDTLSPEIRYTLSILSRLLEREKMLSSRYKTGLADRERDVADARKELTSLRIELDLVRALQEQQRKELQQEKELSQSYKEGVIGRQKDLAEARKAMTSLSAELDLSRALYEQQRVELQQKNELSQSYKDGMIGREKDLAEARKAMTSLSAELNLFRALYDQQQVELSEAKTFVEKAHILQTFIGATPQT